jgi:formylglycine-generating enzyme required for sulfatase activity
MFKLHTIVVLFLFAGSVAIGQSNTAAFFRISSPSNAVITDFDPIAGTMGWSNSVAGATNQVQKAHKLNGTGDWVDYVKIISPDTVTVSERLIDLNPPAGMVLIPGGINYGHNPLGSTTGGSESYSESYPETYSLAVSDFYMDRTEVTKSLWETVYNWAVTNDYVFDNTGSGKAPDHPVHTVNWYDCVKWCNARSEMEGKTPCYTISGNKVYTSGQSEPNSNAGADGYRLPTRDEWEYAARGGRISLRFPWGDIITHNEANYYGNPGYLSYDASSEIGYHPSYAVGGLPYTSPAGSFPANGYGVCDIAGNVWEWCWDESVYSDPPHNIERCLRGGSWTDPANSARCGWTDGINPASASNTDGFRTICR